MRNAEDAEDNADIFLSVPFAYSAVYRFCHVERSRDISNLFPSIRTEES